MKKYTAIYQRPALLSGGKGFIIDKMLFTAKKKCLEQVIAATFPNGEVVAVLKGHCQGAWED